MNSKLEGFKRELRPPASYGGWWHLMWRAVLMRFAAECWALGPKWTQMKSPLKQWASFYQLWDHGFVFARLSSMGSRFWLAAEKESTQFLSFVKFKSKTESFVSLPQSQPGNIIIFLLSNMFLIDATWKLLWRPRNQSPPYYAVMASHNLCLWLQSHSFLSLPFLLERAECWPRARTAPSYHNYKLQFMSCVAGLLLSSCSRHRHVHFPLIWGSFAICLS